jgi:apolipoprotein N-acyltransferase
MDNDWGGCLWLISFLFLLLSGGRAAVLSKNLEWRRSWGPSDWMFWFFCCFSGLVLRMLMINEIPIFHSDLISSS